MMTENPLKDRHTLIERSNTLIEHSDHCILNARWLAIETKRA